MYDLDPKVKVIGKKVGICDGVPSTAALVDLLFYVPPIVYGGSVLVFVLVCITLFLSSFAIIVTRKRELVTLLLLSFGCLAIGNAM